MASSDEIYEGLSENEREDEENENYRMPARPKRAPAGWVRRVRCDECRQNLGFMGLNMAVPIGTPVLCGPCVGKEDVRNRALPLPGFVRAMLELRAVANLKAVDLHRQGHLGKPGDVDMSAERVGWCWHDMLEGAKKALLKYPREVVAKVYGEKATAENADAGCQGSLNGVLCGKKPVEFESITKKMLCASHRESVENVAAIFNHLERDAAIERFWERERDLTAQQTVLVSRKLVPALHVVDVDGGQVFEGAPPETEGFLFWIDQEPSANWAHPCRYVLMFKSGGLASAQREWPPGETIYDKLDRIERPWPNGGGRELHPKDYYRAKFVETTGAVAVGTEVVVVDHVVSPEGEKGCVLEVGPWLKDGEPRDVTVVDARKLKLVAKVKP